MIYLKNGFYMNDDVQGLKISRQTILHNLQFDISELKIDPVSVGKIITETLGKLRKLIILYDNTNSRCISQIKVLIQNLFVLSEYAGECNINMDIFMNCADLEFGISFLVSYAGYDCDIVRHLRILGFEIRKWSFISCICGFISEYTSESVNKRCKDFIIYIYDLGCRVPENYFDRSQKVSYSNYDLCKLRMQEILVEYKDRITLFDRMSSVLRYSLES